MPPGLLTHKQRWRRQVSRHQRRNEHHDELYQQVNNMMKIL